MAARKDPATVVVAYFDTAPLPTAITLLTVCKDILKRRLQANNTPDTVKRPKVVRSRPADDPKDLEKIG